MRGQSALPSTRLAAEDAFALYRITLEERQEGRVLWTGSAETVRGAEDQAYVGRLALSRKGESVGDGQLEVTADGAHVSLGTGTTRLTEVVASLPDGRLVRTAQARFFAEDRRLCAEAPVELWGEGLRCHAEGAQIDLDKEEVTIAGPITGHQDRPPTRP